MIPTAPLMLEDKEIDLVLQDLIEHYNFDFTYYSRDSLKRRINRIYKLEKFMSLDEFRKKIGTDAAYFEHFLDRVTVNVTEMFRDHNFFKELKTYVFPELAKRPMIKIWHAGCSTGEEVYSMAVLLHEAGLLHKTTLHGTDINPRVLAKAREGIYPVSLMQLYAKNYTLSGGNNNFKNYYQSTPQGEKFNDEFRSRMIFTRHNLATDGFLHRFDLIICRNVLIYFDKKLQERVFRLFDDSTGPFSYLALGEKETLGFSSIRGKFKKPGKENIWKKDI